LLRWTEDQGQKQRLSKYGVLSFWCSIFLVFDFVSVFSFSCLFLTFPHISQAIEAWRVTWAFCASMSERFLRVLAQHVIRHASMGTPCFLRGDRRSDGFFWLLFLAVEKK